MKTLNAALLISFSIMIFAINSEPKVRRLVESRSQAAKYTDGKILDESQLLGDEVTIYVKDNTGEAVDVSEKVRMLKGYEGINKLTQIRLKTDQVLVIRKDASGKIEGKFINSDAKGYMEFATGYQDHAQMP